jgi:hypothetical protein
LSKYDLRGLEALGLGSFTEAFNVLGYALGSRPASIKNYRDEFDPLFPNGRKGWHKREIRGYCIEVLRKYEALDFGSFTGLIESFVGYDSNAASLLADNERSDQEASGFAQRLITGIAAENYFEAQFMTFAGFAGYRVENTTRLGCGFDYRLRVEPTDENYLAVEVKGLQGTRGNITMTPKEYEVAGRLKSRFFLFVVRNFREVPSHDIYQDPLCGPLRFSKVERVMVQTSWSTNI